MKPKRTSSAQIPALGGPPVDTFYRISERMLLSTVKGQLVAATIEDMIKQMRTELAKFPGDIKPLVWSFDAVDVTSFDALGIQEPARRLAVLVKESVGDHVILIRSESGGPSASPLIMIMRGLTFGAQLKLRVVANRDELASALEQIRKERGQP